MADQTSDNDKGKSEQSVPQSSIQTNVGELKKEETETEKNNTAAAVQSAYTDPKPSRLNQLWQSLKNTEASNRTIALATVVIAASTIVQIGIAVAQYREMRSGGQQTAQIIHAADDIKLALTAANSQNLDAVNRTLGQSQAATDASNKQSQTALDASINNARLDQRPWVGLQSLQCNNCRMATDGSLIIGDLSAMVVNTGKTPAIDMIVEYTFVSINASDPIPTYDSIEKMSKANQERAFTVPSNLPPDIAADVAKDMALVKRRITPSKEVLAPNAHRGITIIAGLKQERNIETSMGDQNVVYGLGKITYYDTSHAIQHTTMFCVMNEFGTSFRYCPSGNEMN